MKAVARAIPRAGLGLVLVVAGLLKGADPSEFVRQVGSYGILPAKAAGLFAYALIPVEVGLGIALLAGFLPRLSAMAGSLLMLFFMGVTAYGWSTGRTDGCGCFGSLASRTPGDVLLEDTGFLALGILAFFLGGREEPRRWWRGAAVAAAVAGSILLSVSAYYLPLDSLVTGLRVGRPVASLPLRESPVDLASGDHLVALLDLGSPGAGAVVKKLNEYDEIPGVPRVIAFYGGEVDEKAVFCFNYSPNFEVVPMLRSDLKTLYRRLPRFFRVRDGRVVRIWNGTPPGPEDYR
jgi:uncharacterized membrane protein YphA (DoxX/SURF4 family)